MNALMSRGRPLLMAGVHIIIIQVILIGVILSGAVSSSGSDAGGSRMLSVKLPSGKEISAEVAATRIEKQMGLMFRESLAEDQGMLFVYAEDDFHRVWMKNCLIPLDILWLDREGRVLDMKKRAPPCRNENCPTYSPSLKSRYVLEVQAGLLERERIGTGAQILFFTSGPTPKIILPSP